MNTEIPTALLEYHAHFPDAGGVRWRLTKSGIEVEGSGIERTRGEPKTVRHIWETFGTAINQYANTYDVPAELIVATIATESGGNPNAIRKEPKYVSDEKTPHQISPGLMQTLISTARSALNNSAIDREWLLIPSNSIHAGTAYISQQKATTKHDPPLVAAAYNAGDLYRNASINNRWRLRQYPIGTAEHCNRFIAFFNDFWALLSDHGIRPTVSFHATMSGNARALFPVNIKGDRVTPDSIHALYDHTEKEHVGGNFPIGLNSVWHGGVHLRVPEGSPVVACLGGTIVAARVGAEPGRYGSRDFVLIKHTARGTELNLAAAKAAGKRYRKFSVMTASLYLRPTPGIPAGDDDPLPLGKLKKGDVVGIVDTTPKRANDIVWIQVKVTTSSQADLVGKKGYIATSAGLVEPIYDDPPHPFEDESSHPFWSLYMHLAPVPSTTKPSPSSPPWMAALSQEAKGKLQEGGMVAPGVTVSAGDLLGYSGSHGSIGSRAALLHWEIFSEKNLFPKFRASEDLDSDFNLDTAEILTKVEQRGWFERDVIDAEELAAFYQTNAAAAQLRRWACRFTSEWGVDLAVAIPKLRGRWTTWGLEEALRPYLWWHEALKAGVDIPTDPRVWHYNPIAFMEFMASGHSTGTTADVPRRRSGMDIEKAVAHLRSHAEASSVGRCARYTREAIEAGGVKLIRAGSAKNYGQSLIQAGFLERSSKDLTPEKGDVVIFDAISGHPHGHMAMYDGNGWISDFKQRDIYAGPAYRNIKAAHKIYRP